MEHPERYSAWVNRPVRWLSVLVWPFRVLLGGLTALTLRVVGSERKQGEPEISEEELRTLVDVGAREGIVDRTEREMIHKVFELEDRLVREVMVPRPDMFCLDLATPPPDILPLLREHLHSRVPVFDETVDQIVGVLYTKDLLPYLRGLPPGFDVRAHLHPPYVVPESKRADALLREFHRDRACHGRVRHVDPVPSLHARRISRRDGNRGLLRSRRVFRRPARAGVHW